MSALVTDSKKAACTGVQRLRTVRRRQMRRAAVAFTFLMLGLVAALGVRVLLGTYTVTIPDFFTLLSGGDIKVRGARFIVMEDKLPRAVLGALAGLAFGCSGAIFQLLLRNPLASPDIIGISNGASLGAVIAIVYWGASGFTISVFAIVCALVTAVVTMLLASGGTNVGNRFILTGIGVAALCNAVVIYLMERISLGQATTASVWMIGSLAPANWGRINILFTMLIMLLPLVLWGVRPLKASAVGDELAHGIGVPVGGIRWYYIAVGVLLAAVATAAVGPVAFVAFVAGPIARRMMGGRHTLVGAALVGAIIVVAADFAAANMFPGKSFPAGIFTGAFGAPVLMWLLVQGQKKGK
ncbi:MAG: iron chelate uptake ABC transporter family permease subunit [Rothia sp. (in: high G+C Gram-positive bacteria)]|uniref:FecCD family ABC transporter permease n=1 Tax=Rothia sp. (in: high G+C Gram-positive bacteria) TaxID=1885016 RepID=UPI0026DB1C08|nr:iron chelate uptake ABC transporter family permease subunit [Rothia sp. (in: high G+C Gram-positive bacteria)]MDO4885047.1 iron chelate uptake ABC transporter family permease subunit [Rothia sp. (in: high G+C Gram-positive bacteria)]